MVGVLLDPWRPCPARAKTTTLPAITTSTTSSAPMLASQRLRPDCPGCPVDCCTSICSVSGCRVCIENLLHSDAIHRDHIPIPSIGNDDIERQKVPQIPLNVDTMLYEE